MVISVLVIKKKFDFPARIKTMNPLKAFFFVWFAISAIIYLVSSFLSDKKQKENEIRRR